MCMEPRSVAVIMPMVLMRQHRNSSLLFSRNPLARLVGYELLVLPLPEPLASREIAPCFFPVGMPSQERRASRIAAAKPTKVLNPARAQRRAPAPSFFPSRSVGLGGQVSPPLFPRQTTTPDHSRTRECEVAEEAIPVLAKSE